MAWHNHLRGDIYAKEYDKLHAVITDGQLSRHLATAFFLTIKNQPLRLVGNY